MKPFSAVPPSSDLRAFGFGHFRCVSNPLGMGVNVLIPSSFLQQKKAVYVNTYASPTADLSDSDPKVCTFWKQVRLPAQRSAAQGPRPRTTPAWGRGRGRASGPVRAARVRVRGSGAGPRL